MRPPAAGAGRVATVGPMRAVDVAGRRARLGRRHHLAPGTAAADVASVARDLVALHATDAATVHLAARARGQGLTPADVEAALYDDRSVIRLLGMRHTMFVMPTELVAVVHGACTRAVAVKERRRLVGQVEAAGVAEDGARWLDEVEAATLAALADLGGEATARELGARVDRLGVSIPTAVGKPYEGRLSVSTSVLRGLAAAGKVVRGRPLGTWQSSQYRWALTEAWLGPADRGVDDLDTPTARAELARRWLAAFGPATEADLRWWAGWGARDTARALADIGAVPVDLGGGTGVCLPGDDGPVDACAPWVALLPALDPTVMGWKERHWYLGDHAPALFDRSGNPGPTVWADGRIVGGWAQRGTGEVVTRLLEDVGAATAEAVDAEAADLTAWLGDARVTPRFRTPLERELTA